MRPGSSTHLQTYALQTPMLPRSLLQLEAVPTMESLKSSARACLHIFWRLGTPPSTHAKALAVNRAVQPTEKTSMSSQQQPPSLEAEPKESTAGCQGEGSR